MDKRGFKSKAYSLLAQVVKAMANPHRLEIIDLLAQGERTVEQIAGEAGLSVANASQHLQVLKGSNLVAIERQGNFIRYRLANEAVFAAWASLRRLGFERMAEAGRLVKDHRQEKGMFEVLGLEELLEKLPSGDVVLLDIRPEQEYQAGHIPGAVSVPIEQLPSFSKKLSKHKEYVAYCRGPLCVFADDAVRFLNKEGFKAKRLEEGFPDWKLKQLAADRSSIHQ